MLWIALFCGFFVDSAAGETDATFASATSAGDSINGQNPTFPDRARKSRAGRNRVMLIWHPDVHKAFGEELFLFLIRSRSFSREYREFVARAIRERAPNAWVIMETLGFYDLLVRAWLTSREYSEFLDVVCQSDETWRIRDIRCTSVLYLWSENFRARPSLRPGEVLKFSRAQMETAQTGTPDADLVNRMISAGLMLPDTLERSKNPRFYSLIKLLPEDQDVELKPRLGNELLELAGRWHVTGLSVHASRGFADFVIKGRATGIDQIAEFSLGLRELDSLRPRMRTETIVAREPAEPVEWDHINFAAAITSPELHLSFNQFVGVQLPTQGEPTAQDVLDTFESVQALFRVDTEEYLHRVFHGWLKHSAVEVKLAAVPILQTEGLLRAYFQRKMIEAYGHNWVKDGLGTIAGRAELKERGKNLSQYTFADLTSCLNALDAEKAVRVEAELGAGWEQVLRQIEKIRNRCAHSLEEEAAQPRQFVENLATLLPMYYKLQAALNKSEVLS
jgi:hypothetical protein